MELIDKVNKYFRDVLCVEYLGHMEYDSDPEEDYYSLSFTLNPDATERPLFLQGQFLSEDSFYDYVIRNIKDKRFHLYKNFRTTRVDENGAIDPKKVKEDVGKRL